MRKIVLIIAAFTVFSTVGYSQQLGQYSQYLQNMYVLNPAAAGMNHQLDVNLSYRQQWVGIDNAPENYYLTVSAPLGKEYAKPNYKPSSTRISRPNRYKSYNRKRKLYHGLGGMAAVHEIGAFRKTLGNLSYAVHLPVTKSVTLGFGASGGISNHSFDQNKVDLDAATDATYSNFIAGGTSTSVFDLNFGGFAYTDRWFVGYSSSQLLGNEIAFGENPTDASLSTHHFVTAGYKYYIDANFTATPSVLFKGISGLPAAYDINLRVDFQDRLWGAISYRNEDAIVAILGVTFNDFVRVGYSYDYTTSALSPYTSGSHEVFLGLMLNKRNKITF